MKKNYLLATALAIMTMASCSDNDFVGDQEALNSSGNGAITFGFDVPAPTRAAGADAAGKLNSQFIVWGEKNETDETEATVASGNLVFPNYKVTYTANTAYTSTSNTKDWEYVGLAYGAESANVKIKGTAVTTDAQTIKYWDYNATSYTFTAVSAHPTDISSAKVIIDKVAAGSTNQYDKGYTVTVTDMADLSSLYFADRVNIAQSADKDRTKENTYGGNVKFTFRNGVSKVRVGIYETIPGYDVKIKKFYYDSDADAADAAKPAFSDMTDGNTTNFVASVPSVSPDVANSKTSVAGTFTVKYYEKNTANDAAGISNHPTISFEPTASTDRKQYLTLGTEIITATKLGETSTAATFDTADGADADSEPDYTTVFPQETNNKNMKLKVDYQLKNTITGETIDITGKTAEVPAKYLQWKPNYKYTYLFKINDNDLYPITFDAVTIEAEDGTVEYITTVTEPSITTYAKGSAVTVNGEYKAGELIYAVVEDASGLATLSASNMKLYTVTTSDAENFPITEASVAEAIAEYPIMSAAEQTAAKIKFTASSFSYGKTVVAEDGSTVTMNADNNVVASFTGAAITSPSAAPQYYAIEYIKTPATYGNDGGKTYATSEAFTAAGTLYSDAACTSVADATYYSSHTGDTYYKKTHVTAVGTYAYKIVKVVPAP